VISKKLDPVSFMAEPTPTRGLETSKSSSEMNISDVPAIIKQWMALNQTRCQSQICDENSLNKMFDVPDKKLLVSKLDNNLMIEDATPVSESSTIIRAIEEIEEKKKYFQMVEEENAKLKEEIEKYRASFKDMKTNML
jgi:hypothetical protein